MSDHIIEQEMNPNDPNYLNWFIWDEPSMENKPFDTEEQAIEYIPELEADKAERAWERQQEQMMEDGSSPSVNRAEEQQRMIEYQKLK